MGDGARVCTTEAGRSAREPIDLDRGLITCSAGFPTGAGGPQKLTKATKSGRVAISPRITRFFTDGGPGSGFAPQRRDGRQREPIDLDRGLISCSAGFPTGAGGATEVNKGNEERPRCSFRSVLVIGAAAVAPVLDVADQVLTASNAEELTGKLRDHKIRVYPRPGPSRRRRRLTSRKRLLESARPNGNPITPWSDTPVAPQVSRDHFASGLTHFNLGNLAKSVSELCRTRPRSIARAAKWASVVRLPAVPACCTSDFNSAK